MRIISQGNVIRIQFYVEIFSKNEDNKLLNFQGKVCLIHAEG